MGMLDFGNNQVTGFDLNLLENVWQDMKNCCLAMIPNTLTELEDYYYYFF
jgi:hypothetical protein